MPTPLPARSKSGLPSWAQALPLWMGKDWLWIDFDLSGHPLILAGDAEGGALLRIERLPLRPYEVIVLRYRSATPVPSTYWEQIASTLAKGGVLFVCGPKKDSLSQEIAACTTHLWVGEWHVIEPQEDEWRLRPDSASALRWFDKHLSPPYGLRGWLRQVRRRWLGSSAHVFCLTVYNEDDL